MKYRSTVGGYRDLTFRQALFSTSFMDDGGLLLPESIPKLDQHTLQAWSSMEYRELVFEITKLYIDENEIPREDLKRLIKDALSQFKLDEILPVKDLNGGLKVLEMFHGKSWAFKDLSLSCVGKLMEYFLSKDGSRCMVLCATSGDTGSSLLEAVRGLDQVDCIVFLPRGLCTTVQELQMTTVIEENLRVIRVDGNSDELDDVLKACFDDADLVQRHRLMCLNSVNWARMMVQVAHHFYAYFRSCRHLGDPVEIIIPTGGMGNVTSGVIAYKMGLPVRFVCAVTVNDVIDRTLASGEMVIMDDVIHTFATAINIANPYNMQRVISLLSDDQEQVTSFVRDLEHKHRAKIPQPILDKMRRLISSYKGNDDVIKQTIRRCYQDNQYVICPHTALAVAYHYLQADNGIDSNRICLATASPLKFGDAVTSSGVPVPDSDLVNELLTKPTKFVDMDKGPGLIEEVKATIREMGRKHDYSDTCL